MKRLTPKQKLFCKEYLIDLNATQSAVRAGYSKKTAGKMGAKLVVKSGIQEEIQKQMKAREERTEIKADDVLREIARIAYSDITDFLKIKSVETKEGTIRQVEIFATDDIGKEKTPIISEIKETKTGISLKLHDKVKSLELLCRHLGLLKERVELSGDIIIDVEFDEGDDDEA